MPNVIIRVAPAVEGKRRNAITIDGAEVATFITDDGPVVLNLSVEVDPTPELAVVSGGAAGE